MHIIGRKILFLPFPRIHNTEARAAVPGFFFLALAFPARMKRRANGRKLLHYHPKILYFFKAVPVRNARPPQAAHTLGSTLLCGN